MQILLHSQIAMTMETYSGADSADQKCSQAVGQATQWPGLLYETVKDRSRVRNLPLKWS